MSDRSLTKTLFEQVGGQATIDAIVDRFYHHMDTLPQAHTIRAMHAADLGDIKVVLKKYLAEWLGGPSAYSLERGHPRLRMRHMPFKIGESERDTWMLCMRNAFNEVLGTHAMSEPILEQLYKVADWMRNVEESTDVAAHSLPMREPEQNSP